MVFANGANVLFVYFGTHLLTHTTYKFWLIFRINRVLFQLRIFLFWNKHNFSMKRRKSQLWPRVKLNFLNVRHVHHTMKCTICCTVTNVQRLSFSHSHSHSLNCVSRRNELFVRRTTVNILENCGNNVENKQKSMTSWRGINEWWTMNMLYIEWNRYIH
jgi:hypothetical protein